MEITILTIVLGMIVSFTLPLVIVSCVLVYILWSRSEKFIASDVEMVSQNFCQVTKRSEDPKPFKVFSNLYSFIFRYALQETDNMQHLGNKLRLKKATSVASKLIRFGRIQDMEGLTRLTSHLTGVVIVHNPALHNSNSEQDKDKDALIEMHI